jgi:hypothetical protein
MGPKAHLSAFGDVTRLDSYVRFAVAALLQPQTLVTKSPCDRPINNGTSSPNMADLQMLTSVLQTDAHAYTGDSVANMQ